MFIDLRHHIVSLAAVFLALAVGISVGSSFINGSSIERQVAKSLQKEFAKLSAENDEKQGTIEDLSEQLKRHTEFDRSILPILTAGQLAGKHVAIIQTGDCNEATQSVASALEGAGATVTSKTAIANLDVPSVNDIVKSITGEPNSPTPALRAVALLANAVSSGQNRETLVAMQNGGLITCSGEYDRRAVDVVVVGGGRQEGSNRAGKVDKVLIDKLRANGVTTIVGVEPLHSTTSYISTYRTKGISTVDDVDLPIGQVALVFCVRGDTGNYGLKSTAERVVPAFLESGQWHSKSRF